MVHFNSLENAGSFVQDVKSELSHSIRVLEEVRLEMQDLKIQLLSDNEEAKDENIENLQYLKFF